MTFWFLLFTGSLFLCLAVFFLIVRSTIFAPEIIVFFTCALLAILSSRWALNFPELRVYPFFLFYLGAFLLGISAFLCSKGVIMRRADRVVLRYAYSFFDQIVLLMAWIAITALLFKAFELSLTGPFNSRLMNLRWQVSSSDGTGFGVFGYLTPFLTIVSLRQVILFSQLPRRSFNSKLVFLAYFIPGLLSSFLSVGRGHVVSFVVATLVVHVLVKRRMPLGFSIIVFLVMLTTYAGLGILLGKLGSNKGVVETVFVSIENYFVMPVLAWAFSLDNFSSDGGGIFSFRIIDAIINKVGISSGGVVSNVREFFVFNGIRTNLYTFVYPYYRDFGFFGIFFLSCVLGSMVGIVFRTALKSSYPMWILLYSLMVMPLFSVFGGERFFVLMSQWFQYFFWSWVLTSNFRIFSRFSKQSL